MPFNLEAATEWAQVVRTLGLPEESSLEDLREVEKLLLEGVRSRAPLPRDLARRLVEAGGKRIRPYLMCLCYRSLLRPEHTPRAEAADLHALAAVAEWVHTATLFHDDVLDASETRRGMPAAQLLHGNRIAVLVGDFVYAEAFHKLMERGLLRPSKKLAETVKTIVEGEILQHQVCQTRNLGLEEYNHIAEAKTGSLFGWCTGTGAWVAGSEEIDSAEKLGTNLGFAFQMADDLIDTYGFDLTAASDDEILHWADSAPPLPVVLAARDEPSRVTELWQSLVDESLPAGTRRALCAELLQICARPAIRQASLDQIKPLIDAATDCLSRMGNTEHLSWAPHIIWQRAQDGAALSTSIPALNPRLAQAVGAGPTP